MPIPIPPDFDYRKEVLDVTELTARDAFQLKIENWAKFRYAIAVGNESSHLCGGISADIKEAYRELGKCHHEVVCSLAYCKLAQFDMMLGNLFVLQKAIKDFYFHGGALLDNLSRIIYIISIPDAASANTKKDKTGDLIRRVIGRGRLLRDYRSDIGPYLPHINSSLIDEFVSVRNTFAHYWKIPFVDLNWPRDQLRDKAFAWPYDEPAYDSYSGWQPIGEIVQDHFQELERAQDAIFGLLLNDIAKFEVNNGVTIQ
jgi:hypothetical protein